MFFFYTIAEFYAFAYFYAFLCIKQVGFLLLYTHKQKGRGQLSLGLDVRAIEEFCVFLGSQNHIKIFITNCDILPLYWYTSGAWRYSSFYKQPCHKVSHWNFSSKYSKLFQTSKLLELESCNFETMFTRCQVSCVKCKFCFLGQRFGAIWLRVCYQWGLPCLVFSLFNTTLSLNHYYLQGTYKIWPCLSICQDKFIKNPCFCSF